MKRYSRIIIVMSSLLTALLPLSASSSYAIAETEQNANPPAIYSSKRKPPLKQTSKNHTETVSKINTIAERNLPKTIYLTFDDGPGKGTANVMRVLQEEGVEGTMFFVGRHIQKHRALYTQALSMPNLLVGNHTYSHANGKYALFYSQTATMVNDVDRAQRIIGAAKYLRLAGRNVWRLPSVYKNDYALSKSRRVIEKPKYTALSNRGYQIYGWDIEWHFDHLTGRPAYGADQMAERVKSLYQKHRLTKAGKMVLLAHDSMFRGTGGAQKLRALIQILKADGWAFETISTFSRSTPAVFVRKKIPPKKMLPAKKVIRIAMSKKDPLAAQLEKRKQLLKMLR